MEKKRLGEILFMSIKFHLSPRKHYLTVRAANHCNRLPREAVQCPSMDIVETQLDKALSKLLLLTLPQLRPSTR